MRYYKCKKHKTKFKVSHTTIEEGVGFNCLSHSLVEIGKKEYRMTKKLTMRLWHFHHRASQLEKMKEYRLKNLEYTRERQKHWYIKKNLLKED